MVMDWINPPTFSTSKFWKLRKPKFSRDFDEIFGRSLNPAGAAPVPSMTNDLWSKSCAASKSAEEAVLESVRLSHAVKLSLNLVTN